MLHDLLRSLRGRVRVFNVDRARACVCCHPDLRGGLSRRNRALTLLRRSAQMGRMRFVYVIVMFALGCGEQTASPTPAPTPAPTPSERANPPPAPACTTDLDCQTCGLRTGCRCALAPHPECGPMEHPCFAPPCHSSSASCWQGRCYLRPASADPCTADADCEVRADDCRCDLFAALVSSRGSNPCEGQTCGTRPSSREYRARCDTTSSRCVLERQP